MKLEFNFGAPAFVLFAVFLVLRLCEVIDWSWWWVTAPLWIPFGVVIGIVFILFVAAVIMALCGHEFKPRARRRLRRY